MTMSFLRRLSARLILLASMGGRLLGPGFLVGPGRCSRLHVHILALAGLLGSFLLLTAGEVPTRLACPQNGGNAFMIL